MVAIRSIARELPVSFIVGLFIGLAMSIVTYLFQFDAKSVDQGTKDVTMTIIVLVSLGTFCVAAEKAPGFWSREHGHFHFYSNRPWPSPSMIGLALGTSPVWMPIAVLFAALIIRLVLGIFGLWG